MSTELSEVFWISFITASITFLGLVARLCYKSKCKNIECCCIKIIRDVETEEKEMEFLTTRLPNPSPQNNSNTNNESLKL
jgi:hypothetical protein